MRTSSLVLVLLFFAVGGAAFFFSNRMDEAAVNEAVEARLGEAVAEREQELKAQEDSLRSRMEALGAVGVIHAVSPDSVERVLARMGLGYERTTDDDGDPKFAFPLGSYSASMYFYGCDDAGAACASVRLVSTFRLNEEPGLDLVNEWNRTKRFATAYRNSAGALSIDADFVAEGGTTLGALEDFILQFRDSIRGFTRHIDF